METGSKTADQGSVGTLDQATGQGVDPNALPEGVTEETYFGLKIQVNAAGQPHRKEDATTVARLEEIFSSLTMLKDADKFAKLFGQSGTVDVSNPGNMRALAKLVRKSTNYTVSVQGGQFTIAQLFEKVSAKERVAAIALGVR